MTDENDEANRQRLRWWQEEKAVIPPVGGVAVRTQAMEVKKETEAVLPDIGIELEEEAMRRSLALSHGERVEIYANAKQNDQRMRKRVVIVAIPLVLYIAGLAAIAHTPLILLSLLLLALEFAVLYNVMKRFNAKQTRPKVTLTKEGIEIHSMWQDLGLIRWDEIREIRAYTQIYRYVGIVPKDMKALCARMTPRQSALIRMNDFCRLRIYRPFRQFVAPINLAQQLMPITADELVKQIEEFRLANHV